MESDIEKFFTESYAPTTTRDWNNWYQEYRRYILKITKEYKPKFNKYKR